METSNALIRGNLEKKYLFVGFFLLKYVFYLI